jgi:putative ATPase
VLQKREIQAAVILDDLPGGEPGEFLSWSASSKGREGWFKRLESGRSALLLSDRDAVLEQCSLTRHDRVLIAAANDGLLLWECLRRCPEGLSAALVDGEDARNTLLRFAGTLDEVEQPAIAVFPQAELPDPAGAETLFETPCFDHILAREPWKRGFGAYPDVANAFSAFAKAAAALLSDRGDLVILQSPPRLGERISRVLAEECAAPAELTEKLQAAEGLFFSTGTITDAKETARPPLSGRLAWDGDTLEQSFTKAGFITTMVVREQREERLILERDIDNWFDGGHSSWGAFIAGQLGEEDFSRCRALLLERAKQGPLVWKWKSLVLRGTRL